MKKRAIAWLGGATALAVLVSCILVFAKKAQAEALADRNASRFVSHDDPNFDEAKEVMRIYARRRLNDRDFDLLMTCLRSVVPTLSTEEERAKRLVLVAKSANIISYEKGPLTSHMTSGLEEYCREVISHDKRDDQWAIAARSCIKMSRAHKLPISKDVEAFYQSDPRPEIRRLAEGKS